MVSDARLEPSDTPEMVEFCSWLLPMVVEATTQPLASTERMASFFPESCSWEVEAMVDDRSVVEALVATMDATFERVDDAVEMKPFRKARVVEVAFSVEPRVVQGKEKVMESR